MIKSLLIIVVSFILGVAIGFVYRYYPTDSSVAFISPLAERIFVRKTRPEVIGFLPYWLLDRAQESYLHTVTDLSYFSLTISDDGTIQKKVNVQEEEPGWTTLKKNSVRERLQRAKTEGMKTSLVVFNGNERSIDTLLSNPIPHAENLIKDIIPIMREYNFDGLNLDIESIIEASASSQQQFTDFVQTIKSGMIANNLGTLTIDITVGSLFQMQRTNPKIIGQLADKIVLMTYDYHYPGSLMVGPVAPLGGAGTERFNDAALSIAKALEFIDRDKLLLGVPLYGYEWETLSEASKSAIIPATGQTASDRRAEELVSTCTTCTVRRDPISKESYIMFPEQGIYKHMYYTDAQAIKERAQFVQSMEIGGMAFWALGYEAKDSLTTMLLQ